MKTKSLLAMVLIVAFVVFGNSVNAQTYQFNLHAVLTHAVLPCFGDGVSGDFTYHFTYHLNNNSELEWIHWNILKSSFTNDVTGEEYFAQDTGHDNCNLLEQWDIYNNLNAFNMGYGLVYDQKDGFMTQYLPEIMPDEGTCIHPGSLFH